MSARPPGDRGVTGTPVSHNLAARHCRLVDPDRHCHVALGLQLAGAETGRRRSAAAHVSLASRFPFGATGLLLIAKFAGDSIRIPRAMWGRVCLLALFNSSPAGNGLLLFGVQELPAGRSVILAFTMPAWSTLFSRSCCLHEPPVAPQGRRASSSGIARHGDCCWFDDVRNLGRRAHGGLAHPRGVDVVGVRHRSGPQMEASAVADGRVGLDAAGGMGAASQSSRRSWGPCSVHDLFGGSSRALLYNIFLAGTLAHWAFYRLARSLPVAVVRRCSSAAGAHRSACLSGMLLLGERPGPSEWIALLLVVAAMIAVLWTPKPAPSPPAPDS